MKVKATGMFPGKYEWWYTVGKVYNVRKYPYKATDGATINKCFCSECVKERKDKKLYEMYENIETGGLIPAVFCTPVNKEENSNITQQSLPAAGTKPPLAYGTLETSGSE